MLAREDDINHGFLVSAAKNFFILSPSRLSFLRFSAYLYLASGSVTLHDTNVSFPCTKFIFA